MSQTNLRTKSARSKLAARSAAYFLTLATGRALGYRKRTAGKPGKWLVRVGGKHSTLGTADDTTPADGVGVLDFGQAMQAAIAATSLDPARLSATDALDQWADWKCSTENRNTRRMGFIATAKRIARGLPDGATLSSLSVPEIDAWMAAPTRAGRATRNRLLAVLKAALNRAADRHGYEGRRAWTNARKHAAADADGARQVILTETEESALIDAAEPPMARLLRGMQLTGARTGELTEAFCGDLFGDRLTLRGKTGQRVITLSESTADWFRLVVGNRPDADRMFLQEHGAPWDSNVHIRPFNRAVKAAGLIERNPDTYTFRHGYISRALTRGVPAVAVAQRCGTSVRMLERYYAKFHPSDVSDWFG